MNAQSMAGFLRRNKRLGAQSSSAIRSCRLHYADWRQHVKAHVLVKHRIAAAFSIKGKLHVCDVLGMRVAHLLKPGAEISCTFQSPDGEQIKAVGKVAFELINYKGRERNQEGFGGSLIFHPIPTPCVPIGWDLFAAVPE